MSMRKEVEKIRDVMKMQWDEMKKLRNQNEGMRMDLREIKELLVSDVQRKASSASLETQSHMHFDGPFKQYHIHSDNNNSPVRLSLPGLSRENTSSRLSQARRKKN